jgi:hypothetical protein
MSQLVHAANAGNPTAVVVSLTTPTHWDVYDQFGDSALTSSADVDSFAARLAAHGDRWTLLGVDPPAGDAGLPDSAVYDAILTVQPNSRTLKSSAKVVIDCHAGLIQRMVGPTVGDA